MTMYRIKTLAELVDGWRKTSLARNLASELLERLKEGKAPFEGAPLPDALVKKRLPAGIKSAWMFVLRAETTTPSHYHPNSVQYMAVIGGGGTALIDGRESVLRPFDPAFPGKSLYVIAEKVPHAFETGLEPVIVLSFHTVEAGELIEVDEESGKRRTL